MALALTPAPPADGHNRRFEGELRGFRTQLLDIVRHTSEGPASHSYSSPDWSHWETSGPIIPVRPPFLERAQTGAGLCYRAIRGAFYAYGRDIAPCALRSRPRLIGSGVDSTINEAVPRGGRFEMRGVAR